MPGRGQVPDGMAQIAWRGWGCYLRRCVKKLLGTIAVAFLVSFFLSACSRTGGRSDLPSVSGTIDTDEVHVASRYGGRVVHLPVREGDGLQAGQLIAELDATELAAMIGRSTSELPAELRRPAVHADDLVAV